MSMWDCREYTMALRLTEPTNKIYSLTCNGIKGIALTKRDKRYNSKGDITRQPKEASRENSQDKQQHHFLRKTSKRNTA